MAHKAKRKRTEEYNCKKKSYDQARARTRINIGEAFQRWRDIRERQGLKTDAEVALNLLDANPWDREVYCPLCFKPQTKITVHLRKSCMKDADDEDVEEEALRAKELQMKWSREGRIIDIAEVKEIVRNDPSCDDLAEYFERKGFFITHQDRTTEKKDVFANVIAKAKVEMDSIFKELVEKKSVPEKDRTAFRHYCVATLMWMHNQTCRNIIDFKVQDWINRRKEGDKVHIQFSERNTVELNEQEEAWFDCYFCNIRPECLKKSNNKEHQENFFLGISGDALKNPAVDAERLRNRYVERILEKTATPVIMPKPHVTHYNTPVSLWMTFQKQFPVAVNGNPPTQQQHVLGHFTGKTTWTTNIPAVNDVLLAWVPTVQPAPTRIESNMSTENLIAEHEKTAAAIQNKEKVEMDLPKINSFKEQQETEAVIKEQEVETNLPTISSAAELQTRIELVIKKEEELEMDQFAMNSVTEQQRIDSVNEEEDKRKETVTTMKFTRNLTVHDYHSEEVPKPAEKNFTEPSSSVFFKCKEGHHSVRSTFKENEPFS